jgi:predicted chitinase
MATLAQIQPKLLPQHYELSPERAAHLLGQAAHESGGFNHTRENLNYSAEGYMLYLEKPF